MARKSAGSDRGGSEKPGVNAARSNLYLVGFMGSGKTSVGRRLAELLGWTFLDLDEEIEKCEGKSIPEIFRQQGEGHFRSLEHRELVRACLGTRTVVALGGGTFCHAKNREIITRTGLSIWLDAPIGLLLARCGACPDSRPLFAGIDEMTTLLERRLPAYAQAEVRVPVDTLSIDELARRIIAEIREHAAPSPG